MFWVFFLLLFWQTWLNYSASGYRVYNSTSQSIPNATTTALNFDSERFDTDGFHDNSTNNTRITIPAVCDGYYLITEHILTSEGSTSGTLRGLNIKLNGTTIICDNVGALIPNSQRVLVTTIYYLSEGDYLELTFYQDSGFSYSTFVYQQASPEFMVSRLGLG